jgi:hypothetical protein
MRTSRSRTRPSRKCSADNCDAHRASPGGRSPDDGARALGPTSVSRRRAGADGLVHAAGGSGGARRGRHRGVADGGGNPRAVGLLEVLRPVALGRPPVEPQARAPGVLRVAAKSTATDQTSRAAALRDLSASQNKIGDVLVAQGDGPRALAASRRGLATRERCPRAIRPTTGATAWRSAVRRRAATA